MNIAHWAAAHRRSILFLIGVLVVSGTAFSFRLPVALFPDVDFPRVVVSIESGDRPADQMVIAITRPLEEAVRSVPGVTGLRSITSRGSAELSINFSWTTHMVSAMLEVESAVNQSMPQLPSGTGFTVRRMDPTVFPVAAYSLTSDTESLIAMRDLALYQLVPLLSTIPGVAKVTVQGGKAAEYRIEVDPEKLAAFDLTFTDVEARVSASNVLQAVGRLEDHYKLYLLLSDTRFKSIESLNSTVLRSDNSGLVMLGDVARIYETTTPLWQEVSADGHDAVLLQVYQQPGGNTVQIVDLVKQKLLDYEQNLPKDLRIANWYDQSELITQSARSVIDAIAIGGVLAAGVLLLFLRSVKITLMATIMVPAVLASTVILLTVMGMSFNIMTLGGLAAAVGLIVDDSIVVIEHIIRRLRERSTDLVLTIREAAIEFTTPLAGSSAATIVIFAPLAFLDGVIGAFFKALSVTIASALAISFLIAWLVVPLLTEHLLSRADADKDDGGRFFHRLQGLYERTMTRLLPTPAWVLAGLVPLIGVGLVAYNNVGSGFIPHMDEGGFVLDYRARPGTSLAETDRLLRQVETILQANPSVDTYSRRTGLQLGGGLTESNEGDFFVRLTPLPRPKLDEVMDEIRARIEDQVPGLEIELVLLMEDLIGDLTAVPQPIEIELFSDRDDELLHTAPLVAAAIGDINGVVDVNDGVLLAGDAVNIVVDRDKAALEGIDPDEVTRQLDAWFNGLVTTYVQQDIKLVGVRVWVAENVRDRTSAIASVWLQAADGHRFPLKRIAAVTLETGQPQITRDNLKRMVAVTARISGRDLGSTIQDVQKALATPGLLPKGMYYQLGGLYQQQQIAFEGLIAVFLAAVALLFLLLLLMYEEFSAAIAIVATPLLAMSAVFTGLWVTGIELNVTAVMGMTMILGISTEVSIFYFSEFHSLIDAGMDVDAALVAAGKNRLRPITMTTLAAMLALLPLALAMGQGAEMQQPLAVAIISGLLVQIPLVVMVMPLLYRSLPGARGD